ncbi:MULTISPECIES: hypothetical protein [Pseudoalteromonas]|uniref:hypothetical protein n=1 Tax=Pseudoalteromonas TaxID=53246 RepID=UPI001108B6CB|nr:MULTISPECIES: hypothetical protein [Pseudoalteromonas]MBH0088966.1 hypothetical protein [Pseudoalteromonas sp. NSLLW218]TMN90954.1 hypothetical protein CWB62_06575 [Pseudoalteromonas sp. S408]
MKNKPIKWQFGVIVRTLSDVCSISGYTFALSGWLHYKKVCDIPLITDMAANSYVLLILACYASHLTLDIIAQWSNRH